MKFQYQSRPAEQWQARAEMKGGGFYITYLKENVPTFSPQAHNWVRIMPPSWGAPYDDGPKANHYGYDVWLHQWIGPSSATVLCPLRHNRGKCPVCEAHARGEAAGKEWEELREFRPVRRVLAWLLDRQAEREKKGDALKPKTRKYMGEAPPLARVQVRTTT